MKVIQAFYPTYGCGNFASVLGEDYYYTTTVLSAAHWKHLFPEDEIVIYLEKNAERTLCSSHTDLLDNYSEILSFKEPLGKEILDHTLYNGSKWLASMLQNEPFIFLDSDMFFFESSREQLDSFRKAVTNSEKDLTVCCYLDKANWYKGKRTQGSVKALLDSFLADYTTEELSKDPEEVVSEFILTGGKHPSLALVGAECLQGSYLINLDRENGIEVGNMHEVVDTTLFDKAVRRFGLQVEYMDPPVHVHLNALRNQDELCTCDLVRLEYESFLENPAKWCTSKEAFLQEFFNLSKQKPAGKGLL